ncbi:zinc-binding dehydrogenase [Metapseudomonas lalkuanensis]|uniref:Zinc-binding dehydrogenase n=1 Tax=Metapseudomonas lalkuanensis TaxID=2604832 RepID=A0A5J6QQI7_9GAMM|nr:zinc-binding dehydrogenase [Pseudomonas lalkuanensis]
MPVCGSPAGRCSGRNLPPRWEKHWAESCTLGSRSAWCSGHRWIGVGWLKPVIARTFGFEQRAEAHRFLESNQQFGKILVTL